MKKLIVLFVLVAAGLVNAATKSNLKDSLVATGNYLYVSDPIAATSPFGSGVAKYTIVLLIESPTDTLVARTTQIYIWVMDDDGPSEQAFYNLSNLANPPAATLSFHERLETKLVNQSIQGHIIETWEVGDLECAVVIKYDDGSDANHAVAESIYITYDGTDWSIRVIE